MRRVGSLVILGAIAVMPYWPGAPNTATDFRPVYNHRIVVTSTIGWLDNLKPALREWNDCGVVHLVVGDLAPYTENEITIIHSDDGGAYGGWSGTYGVVLLGDGWTRSREVIAHEIGHALGFGHAKDNLIGGFNTIMAGAAHVKPADCEGLRHYYG